MSKGNQKSYHGGISPRTMRITRTGDSIDWQALDNSNLKPVNRTGIPTNKQQPGQSRQEYDAACRGSHQ